MTSKELPWGSHGPLGSLVAPKGSFGTFEEIVWDLLAPPSDSQGTPKELPRSSWDPRATRKGHLGTSKELTRKSFYHVFQRFLQCFPYGIQMTPMGRPRSSEGLLWHPQEILRNPLLPQMIKKGLPRISQRPLGTTEGS